MISLKINLLSPWYVWKIAELVLSNNHALTHSITHITFSFHLITNRKDNQFLMTLEYTHVHSRLFLRLIMFSNLVSQLQNDIYTIHILINYKRERAFVYNKIIWFILRVNKEKTKTSSETIIEDFLNISQNVILDIYTVSNAQWFFLRITVT